jgi:hypothetical protein
LPDFGNCRGEQVIIGFFALPFLFLPAQVMTGRESTRDIPLSQSTGMNEDINLLDNILKASLRRFNLRLKVWYEGNSGNQEERYSDAKLCMSLIWKYF